MTEDRRLAELGIPSVHTRTNVMAQFERVLERVSDGESTCFWIEGAEGLGKTPLVRELGERAIELGCMVLRGDGPLPGEHDLPWREMFRQARPPLPLEAVARTLGPPHIERLRDLFEERDWYTMEALGGDAAPHSEGRMQSLVRLLELLSRRAPLVLLIDDLDRADASLAKQIQQLMVALRRAAILWLVTVSSGEGLSELARTLRGRDRLVAHQLSPYSLEELDTLLAPSIEDEDRPRLSRWLHETTEGHPFFVRELLRELVRVGVLRLGAGDGRAALEGDPADAPLPFTFEEMLRARVESLDLPERAVLSALAALGGESSPALLCAVTERAAPEVAHALQQLARERWIEFRESAAGERRVRTLARSPIDVALAMTDPEARAAIFERAGRFVTDDARLDPVVRLSRRAWSWERSRAVALGEQVSAHFEAAQAAWIARRWGQAREHAEIAVRLLGGPGLSGLNDGDGAYGTIAPSLAAFALAMAGRYHVAIGPFATAPAELEAAFRLTEQHRLDVTAADLAEWRRCLGRAYERIGEHRTALCIFEEQLSRLRGTRWTVERALVSYEIAWVHYTREEYEQAFERLEPTLTALRKPQFRRAEQKARNLLGLIHLNQGRIDQASVLLADARRIAEELGDPLMEATISNNLGLALADLGRIDEARGHLRHAYETLEQAGDSFRSAQSLGFRALVEDLSGNYVEAVRLQRRCLRTLRQLDGHVQATGSLGELSMHLARAGEVEDALPLARQAWDECQTLGMVGLVPHLLCVLAEVELHSGERASAIENARRALDAARSENRTRYEATSHLILAEAERTDGNPEQGLVHARAGLALLGAWYPVQRAVLHLEEARCLLQGAEQEAETAAARTLVTEAITCLRTSDAPARARDAGTEFASLGLLPEAAPPHLPPPSITAGVPRIEIRCFGALRITLPGGRELRTPDWESHKARAIFNYLLFHREAPGGVPREKILEAIWPEAPADTVERTFHSTLSLLRRTLGGGGDVWATVVQSGGCYRLQLEGDCWIDCEEFDAAWREAQRFESRGNPFRAQAAYRRAAELYHGDFLEDSFLDWTDAWRDRFRATSVELFLRLALLHLEAWRPAESLRYSQRVLERDALDERAHRAAMRAYHALGQRRAALEQYDRCVERLRQELGAVPDPETTALQRRILGRRAADTPEPRPARPHT